MKKLKSKKIFRKGVIGSLEGAYGGLICGILYPVVISSVAVTTPMYLVNKYTKK